MDYYMKYKYRLKKVGGSLDKEITVALDEYFMDTWKLSIIQIVCPIKTQSKKKIFDVIS